MICKSAVEVTNVSLFKKKKKKERKKALQFLLVVGQPILPGGILVFV